MALDSCPSFAEQKPEGWKPVWLDRHATLQRAYFGQADSLTSPLGSPLARTAPANAAAAAHPLQRYLPGWDISGSGIWLLAETALLKGYCSPLAAALGGASAAAAPAPGEPAPPPRPSALESTSAAPPVAVCAAATISGVLAPAASASPRSPHSTPFAVHHAQAAVAAEPQQPAAPQPAEPRQEDTHQQPPQQQQRQQQEPHAGSGPLTRWLSARRPCPAIPAGLGPLRLPLMPSLPKLLRQTQSAHLHGLLGCGGSGDAGGGGTRPLHRLYSAGGAAAGSGLGAIPEGDDTDASVRPHFQVSGGGAAAAAVRQPHPRASSHVAFAAGVAAATSTFAAASTVTGVAATGVAAAFAAASATSGATLQLSNHALNAGADIMLNKWQGSAVKKAGAAAADAVLGPAASASLRLALRQRLRATVAGASILLFFVHLAAMSDSLSHLDFEHQFVESAKLLLDLATSGPSLLENCKDLAQIGFAITMGIAQRDGGGIGGGRG